MSFTDGNFGARVLGSAGASVVQFATINDLITASQGSLAPGYYEVTTVPDYHPQFPRLISYWDGADFLPELSSGFESAPQDLTGLNGWVWDVKEMIFRYKYEAGGKLSTMRNLISTDFISGSFLNGSYVPKQATIFADRLETRKNTTSDAMLHGPNIITAGGPGDYRNHLMIFAGTFVGSLSSRVPVIFVGNNSSANPNVLALQGRGNSGLGRRNEWGMNYTWSTNATHEAFYYSTQVETRPAGDVVILYHEREAQQFTMWVNGVKFGPEPGLALGFLSTATTALGNHAGAGSYADIDYSFWCAVEQPTFNDAAADAWTAWLQDRYSIPAL